MTIEDFIEFVTERTGFCVLSAAVDPKNKTVTIEFDVETDGEAQVIE